MPSTGTFTVKHASKQVRSLSVFIYTLNSMLLFVSALGPKQGPSIDCRASSAERAEGPTRRQNRPADGLTD